MDSVRVIGDKYILLDSIVIRAGQDGQADSITPTENKSVEGADAAAVSIVLQCGQSLTLQGHREGRRQAHSSCTICRLFPGAAVPDKCWGCGGRRETRRGAWGSFCSITCIVLLEVLQESILSSLLIVLLPQQRLSPVETHSVDVALTPSYSSPQGTSCSPRPPVLGCR